MPDETKTQMDKVYDPKKVDEKWYVDWIDKGYYKSAKSGKKPPFSIVIPPPNVTGSLHIGHALNNTLQDILIRWKRMKGSDALWVPGTDHAGIATQMMVERELEREGASRVGMGREKFVARVWKWKQESGDTITRQLRRLGALPDWDMERFTMDEGLSHAVRKVFVDLYNEKLIYKDKRLVNWDPKLCTAISDLEVDQREVTGHFWHFKYPIEGSPGEFITVATTRPETMLGDTAVAVHPEDPRYKHLVGKNVVLPLAERPIPIIADEYSDPEKGTGAVKITPAHDFNDFEVGRRHNLPMINIFDGTAHLNDNVPPKYRGLERFDARKLVIEDMEARGLLDRVEDTRHTVPYGDRSGVVIEPWLTDQWYVDAATLAQPAIKAVEEGRIRFVPKYWENTYYEWLRKIEPWCISRQLWWGHQIPAWYGPDGEIFVALTEEEAHEAAKKHYGKETELRRDPDVLDTWFSSGLWPFSTLGWPEETAELKKYYPTSVLVTGFDIIFFWVARMIMQGIHFMGDVPFRDVYIHGLIRDEKGHKMSKTRGNVIDPLDVIEENGADALRFSLTALATQGRDIKLSMSVIQGYRNFINKIWNASRFLIMNLGDYDDGVKVPDDELSTYDKWILTKLNETVKEVGDSFEGYEFDKAASAIYKFFWSEYCDWYIESVKPVLYGKDPRGKERTKSVLVRVLKTALQLLHPIAPFVSEELYQRLRAFGVELSSVDGGTAESIMLSAFPECNDTQIYRDEHDEVELMKEIVVGIRNLRAVIGLHPSEKVSVVLLPESERARKQIEANRGFILSLAALSGFEIAEKEKPKKAIAQVIPGVEIFLPVEGLIDIGKETERIKKEIGKISKDLERTEKKLANPEFLERAPEEIVQKEREIFEELSFQIKKMEDVLSKLSEIG
ncbi:MAG TPA: valine--tRNA ligase [Thermodesulfobacteriota bacterium]|nr:valine--tRNA ligase [Thermodesulfobacteriota bacterium]